MDNKAQDHQEPSAHFLAGKTILIAGAGVAGLTFAASLAKLWNPADAPPRVVVYDRDSEYVNQQRDGEGYTISISGHTEGQGLATLRNLGILDEIIAHAAAGRHGDGSDGSFKIWNTDWTERARVQRPAVLGLSTPSVRISRKNLRRVLNQAFQSWEHGRVKWNSKCVGVERLENGRLRVQIIRCSSPVMMETATNEETGGQQQEADKVIDEVDCDMLIAADGAHSQLRALLRPQDGLHYTGRVLRGALSRPATAADGSPLYPGRDWGFMISQQDMSCFFSPADNDSIVWAVGSREAAPTPEMKKGCLEDAKAVVERARQLGEGVFPEPFGRLVAGSDLGSVICINASDKKPFRHDVQLLAMPVIFIGDSNHALSPFTGSGGNLAVADGYDLAAQLCTHRSLAEAVAAYDDLSVPRVERIQAVGVRSSSLGAGWRCWYRWVSLSVRRYLALLWQLVSFRKKA